MLLQNHTTGQTREFSIRPFLPTDAPGIIACIRDAYGDTYVKPFLYTEQGVLEHEESGKMLFSVAETDGGTLAGITACELSEHFPGMAEIACQVIMRSCNGYGLALPLALHAMRRAEELALTGQFARALGCHLISQKTLKGMGFTACGFLLNVFDKALFRYHFQNGSYAKIPQSVAVRRQGTGGSAERVWLPEELRPLAEETYRLLGCERELHGAAGTLGGQDVWDREEDARHATLSLWGRTCGEGFSDRLSACLAEVEERPGQTVNLSLNLCRPGSGAAYAAAREQGFFFTGFLPCARDGDYMILHHPLRTPVLLDGIPHISEYAPFMEQIRRQLCERR